MTLLQESVYFGFVLTLLAYLIGAWLKKKIGWAILNPLLVAVVLVITFLCVFHVDYQSYNSSAEYISYLLTPSTVCLAIPLYRQLELLKKNLLAVVTAIFSGVLASAVSIFVLSMVFGLNHQQYVSVLPKSITTAIGMGVSEEAGGIVTITVVCIMITGILGNMIAETVFHIMKIQHPIARGLALGTSAHAIGTAKALELGEVEGAMSSLSIAVAGLMTVVAVPLAAGLL
ncbi:MAG: LrgB family protein [Lachnospiraceae bacterium]|nr:LrgB family protein [Lachnospiraceae bacterium]